MGDQSATLKAPVWSFVVASKQHLLYLHPSTCKNMSVTADDDDDDNDDGGGCVL